MEPMKPMKPMEGMKPMAPMTPMKPMAPPDSRWWPAGLSDPSSSGGQDGLRYAFFPQQKRLVVEQDGKLTQYDTGEHRISGVSQQSSTAAPKFSSESGEVDVGALKQVG